MANEVILPFIAGQLAYFLVVNEKNGQFWNASGPAFEAYLSANYPNYSNNTATQQGTSSFYEGNFPSAIPAGKYGVIARNQLGGSPGEGDPTIGIGAVEWNGSAPVPLSDLATSGQVGQIGPIKLARGVMIQNFGVYLVSAADHVTPFTSGIISGQIAKDGGSFGALQSGAFAETGNGFYNLSALTSGDLLCNTAKLLFTGTGISGGTADPRPFTMILQKVSGQ